LAKSKTFLACHAVDKKLVGPAFKDVATRYTQKDVAQLAASIRKGGAGKWGPIPMPANPQVSEVEATALATWVLKQK
jgi:cytochrome c